MFSGLLPIQWIIKHHIIPRGGDWFESASMPFFAIAETAYRWYQINLSHVIGHMKNNHHSPTIRKVYVHCTPGAQTVDLFAACIDVVLCPAKFDHFTNVQILWIQWVWCRLSGGGWVKGKYRWARMTWNRVMLEIRPGVCRGVWFVDSKLSNVPKFGPAIQPTQIEKSVEVNFFLAPVYNLASAAVICAWLIDA